jgi:hypothetical protein
MEGKERDVGGVLNAEAALVGIARELLGELIRVPHVSLAHMVKLRKIL